MNNTVNDKDYIKLTPFKGWVLENFPFIESDFDCITNYQLLCKITEYLNNVISNQNQVQQLGTELVTAYNQLLDYVNNYFGNLDVQEEINNKLDEMVTDGTFYNLINNLLFTNMNNQIVQNAENIGTIDQELNNTIKTTDTNVITNSMLSQEVREALTGGSTAVVGVNSVGTDNIQDKAITFFKLDDLLNANFTKEYENVELGDDVTGKYISISGTTITENSNGNLSYNEVTLENNVIYDFIGVSWYAVPGIIVVDTTDSNKVIYSSPIENSSNRFGNTHLTFKTNKIGLKAYINKYIDITTATPWELHEIVCLNKIIAISQNEQPNNLSYIKTIEGYGLSINNSTATNIIHIGPNQYANIKVYKISSGTKYTVKGYNIYDYCGLVIANENGVPTYHSNSSNIGSTKQPFTYNFTATNDGYVYLMDFNFGTQIFTSDIYLNKVEDKYKNKKWCLIGDSLTDPNVNESVTKYYTYIQNELGLTLQNLGQSGCGYKRKYNNGNNFVEQSLLLAQDVNVVTIFGSFNDGNEFSNLGTVNDTTTDTVLGSVYVTLNNIITNRPNAKIGIILPTPWVGVNPQNIYVTYLNYLEGIKTIAKKFSVPVLELFYSSNLYPWNTSFKNNYFVNGDGVHPNSDGNYKFYPQIEEFIKSLI